MDHAEKAVALFSQGFNCAQSVLAAFAPELNVSEEAALKMATAFGGGMARQQEICGAYTGALMVIGMLYGRITVADEAARDNSYRLARLLADQFRGQFSTLSCRELVRFDMNTAEGAEQLKLHNVHAQVCEPIVRATARHLSQLLRENPIV